MATQKEAVDEKYIPVFKSSSEVKKGLDRDAQTRASWFIEYRERRRTSFVSADVASHRLKSLIDLHQMNVCASKSLRSYYTYSDIHKLE